jgi:DHA2 family multidrug resistance protein-like MFS transporter
MPRRAFAVTAIALGITMAVLDGAIANVALPAIARQLRIGSIESIWVVNAYQLTIVVALLPFASLGDIHGYRRVYVSGLALFTVSSLGCALSASLTGLVAARICQGLGAAGMMSVNTALVRFIYPRRLIGQGVGINAMVVACSAVIGPSLAAGILAIGDWPWLFAVNIPVGLLALAVSRHLPVTPGSGQRFDLVGALLNAATFGLLITAIDGLAHGGQEIMMAAQVAVAALLAAILVRRQSQHPAPLLPVDLLLRPMFALSIAASICAFCGQMLAFVSVPFHFLIDLHRSQWEAGLLMTPWPATLMVVAPFAGRLADRIPPALLCTVGLLIFASGLGLLATLPAAPDNLQIAWRMAVSGLGFALFQAPNNRTIISSAPVARSGGASGMLGMARLLGQSTGAALVALAFGRFAAHGTQASLWTGAGFALLAALFSVLRPKRQVQS